jgi:hypothetical protein
MADEQPTGPTTDDDIIIVEFPAGTTPPETVLAPAPPEPEKK